MTEITADSSNFRGGFAYLIPNHLGNHDGGHGTGCLLKADASGDRFANRRFDLLSVFFFPKLKSITDGAIAYFGND